MQSNNEKNIFSTQKIAAKNNSTSSRKDKSVHFRFNSINHKKICVKFKSYFEVLRKKESENTETGDRSLNFVFRILMK